MQGKSYFVRVHAMNVCGWSDYSLWNDIRAVTYIYTVHAYILTYIHACINSFIIELFGVVV
jgi:hypothetical protein